MPKHSQRSGLAQTLGASIAVGLMVTLAVTALAYGAVEPWAITLLGLLITFLFGLWMLKAALEGRLKLILPAPLLPLAGLFVYGAVQSVSFTGQGGRRTALSFDPEATRLTLEVLGVLLLAALVAANCLTSRQRLIWLKNFVIVFGLAMAVFGLVQHFAWNGKYYWLFAPSVPPSSPFGPFVNHNHFAGYVEMIAPLPLALILARAVRGEQVLFYAFAVLMISLSNIVSLSRGGMISLFAALMFVVALGIRPRREPQYEDEYDYGFGRGRRRPQRMKTPLLLARLGAAVSISVVILVGVWWIGADPVIRRVEKSELSMERQSDEGTRRETFFQSRGWIWRDTLTMIRNNALTGVGLGAFQTAYPIYSREDGSIIVGQAHNDYLQILADAGIIGGALALTFIFLVFRDLRRALRHRDPMMLGMAVGAAAGVFALLVHSIFDFNLQLPANALLFLTLTVVVSNIGALATAEERMAQPLPAARLQVAA